jgi:hypothetical protein
MGIPKVRIGKVKVAITGVLTISRGGNKNETLEKGYMWVGFPPRDGVEEILVVGSTYGCEEEASNAYGVEETSC